MNIFKKLFKKETPPSFPPQSLTTAPLSPDQLEPAAHGVAKLEPAQLVVGSARSVGRQRDHNEDALFTLTTTVAGNSSSLPFGVFVIADGMGGHQYGEIASEVAVRAMSRFLVKNLYMPIFSVTPESPADSLQEILSNGVKEAQKAVLEKAPGGGTTLTSIVVLGNRMTIAHVGDSRAYAIYLDGRMTPLTRDHSFVKRLEELGQLTAEEAERHPQRNVLIRALGQQEPFEPDITTAPIPQPGYVLICSDGLWGVVPDAEMFRIITTAPNPHRACQSLVDAANAAGGPDNITAILFRLFE